jgi:pyridoxamine 5'-phosphate oxidase family protein
LVSVFTDEEREYLASGVPLGRLATVGSDGATRKKYRDVLRHPKLAFVIDDLVSVSPWRVRGIEIRGEADVLDTGGTELGRGFAPEMFRITPKRIVSWGLSEPMSFNARSVP